MVRLVVMMIAGTRMLWEQSFTLTIRGPVSKMYLFPKCIRKRSHSHDRFASCSDRARFSIRRRRCGTPSHGDGCLLHWTRSSSVHHSAEQCGHFQHTSILLEREGEAVFLHVVDPFACPGDIAVLLSLIPKHAGVPTSLTERGVST